MKKLILLLLLVSVAAFGALPNGLLWEVRHAGADTNGGGYVTGSSGTDFSQQSAAQVAYTDMVLGTGGTTYTSVLHPVGNTLPGNIIQIISGSGCTAGFYEVVSNATITATLDRSAGTVASVCTANLGGALGTLTKLNTAMNTTASIQQNGWVKADATYSISSGIVFNFTNVNVAPLFVAGYTTTRGDGGQPTIQATAGSITMVSIQNNNNLRAFTFANFNLDANAQSGTIGFQMAAFSNSGVNLVVRNFAAANAFDFNQGGTQGTMCLYCMATGGTSGASSFGFVFTGTLLGNMCLYCQVVSSNAGGFNMGGGMCQFCLAGNLTGTVNGFQFAGNSAGSIACDHCTAYKVGGDGFRLSASPVAIYPITIINSASISNTGWGFNNNTGTSIVAGGEYFDYIATFSNGSGAAQGITLGSHSVTLSGDPYVNGTSNNFALNNTSGAGASMRGVGFPGTLAAGGTGFIDIGTLQHGATAGAGATGFPIIQ